MNKTDVEILVEMFNKANIKCKLVSKVEIGVIHSILKCDMGEDGFEFYFDKDDNLITGTY